MDGKYKFTSLINDLKSAKDHIHLLYYIIRDDALGKEISDILIQKAKAGVEVRVLYDDLGSRRLSRRYIRRLKKSGAQVEGFFPPLIPKINLKINFRNHRKLAIDRKSTRLNSSHVAISYAVFCLKKNK